MASIVINEISENYAYNIGDSSYCTVAMPITASWGPGVVPASAEDTLAGSDAEWIRFRSNREGLESFVKTYRGATTLSASIDDYSYQSALTLLASGYDLLVCRMAIGEPASADIKQGSSTVVTIKAKYPGSFGNNIGYSLSGSSEKFSLVVSLNGSAVENVSFEWTGSEVEYDDISEFVTVEVKSSLTLTKSIDGKLAGGTDCPSEYESMKDDILSLIGARNMRGASYYQAVEDAANLTASDLGAELIYTSAYNAMDALTDKLSYSYNRLMTVWDDQNVYRYEPDIEGISFSLGGLPSKIGEVAASSRCGTGIINIPVACDKDEIDYYAKPLSDSLRGAGANDGLGASHSALFAPWGTYRYSGTSRPAKASPAFLALMLQRAMIRNQSLQYEWALPTSRRHNLSISKLDYTFKGSDLAALQKDSGVSVNLIANIPELGTTIWGNSTLYDVLPATYNALQNLSTRFLVNAVENQVYKCGIAISFQYNNDQAYSRFYAGVSPLLDTMKNVGAINGYKMIMSADIDELDSVNANSVIGKIYLTVNGVINNITVDLIALPSSADLTTY